MIDCKSCGHFGHWSTTVGVTCPTSVLGPSGWEMCQCPSLRGVSDSCACEGECPDLREHLPTYCNDDYPDSDPNRCQKWCWDAPTTHRCRKRAGHRGICRRFDDDVCDELGPSDNPCIIRLCNLAATHTGLCNYGARITAAEPIHLNGGESKP